ncbi:MAG: hypothetical protein JWN79_344 [Gemmatimonadetes bacterium]|jgi:hypothetical protein|nr:hypothetical protein [Gemmatimonadota bacterium]
MRHTITRDGIVAGVLGATAVAIWFLGVDLAYGQPFATPAALGRALLRIFGPPGSEGTVVFVAAYTIFHYAAFIVVGLIASAIVHAARYQPAVLAGAMMLFVAFEVGFYGLSAALGEFPDFGSLGGVLVGTGNLIAAGVMGTYLWRTHPELKGQFAHALSGEE